MDRREVHSPGRRYGPRGARAIRAARRWQFRGSNGAAGTHCRGRCLLVGRSRSTSRGRRSFPRSSRVRDMRATSTWLVNGFRSLRSTSRLECADASTGGWNCHQFHANSEFYADFGRFDVRMTVPSTLVVGATGERLSARTITRTAPRRITTCRTVCTTSAGPPIHDSSK